MAGAIAEFIILKSFFEEIKEKKKMVRAKEDFYRDMQFNLVSG